MVTSEWTSGLVIGLLVFGFIFFFSSLIAAIICYNRRKTSLVKMEFFKNLFNCRKKKNSISDTSSQTVLRNKSYKNCAQISENSNSTQLSTISLSSATVLSPTEEPKYLSKSCRGERASALALKFTDHANNNSTNNNNNNREQASSANENDRINDVRWDSPDPRKVKRATLVLKGNNRNNNNADNGSGQQPVGCDNARGTTTTRTTSECIRSVDSIFEKVLAIHGDPMDGQKQLGSSNDRETRDAGNTAQRLSNYLDPQPTAADGLPSPEVSTVPPSSEEEKLNTVERRNEKNVSDISPVQNIQIISEPGLGVAQALAASDEGISGSVERIDLKDGNNIARKNPSTMKLIKSKRPSLLPPTRASRNPSVLTEEKWDSAVDLAFEDFI